MIETLERVEKCDPKFDETKKSFADECKKELGYLTLATTIKRDKTKNKLEKCMDKIGLRPFKQETVERYKEEEANRRWWEHNKPEIKVCGVVTGISASFFLSWFIMYFCSWIAIPIICTIIGVLGIIFAVGCTLSDITRIRAEWLYDHISSCKDPIPEYALQTAVDLQKELKTEGIDSECKFYVESLFIQRVARDPFLFVGCGDNRYYLEVWDEPNFGAEKLV